MIINEKYNKLFNCKYKRKLIITNEYKDISKNDIFSIWLSFSRLILNLEEIEI